MKNIIIASTLLFLITACNNSNEKDLDESQQNKKNMTTELNNRPLENILNTKKNDFELNASDEKKKIYAEGIQDIIDNNIVENALQVGDIAKDFRLKNVNGKDVSLYESLETGPVILIWYRGGWCPYCNLTLHQMQKSLPEFKKYNGNLLALTPELPDNSISTTKKNELEFEVLSDIDNKVAKDYKIVFTLIEEVATIYENGFGLSTYNGNQKSELPLSATYIIGKDKIIKYAFLDADYRKRAEPADLIKVLKEL